MQVIKHPDRTGKTIAALTLLTDHTYRTSVNGGDTIKVSLGPSAVEEFQTEEEFLVWALFQIGAAASRELDWFKKKYPAAYELALVKSIGTTGE
jgi:hypothetical protein